MRETQNRKESPSHLGRRGDDGDAPRVVGSRTTKRWRERSGETWPPVSR